MKKIGKKKTTLLKIIMEKKQMKTRALLKRVIVEKQQMKNMTSFGMYKKWKTILKKKQKTKNTNQKKPTPQKPIILDIGEFERNAFTFPHLMHINFVFLSSAQTITILMIKKPQPQKRWKKKIIVLSKVIIF